MKKFRRAQDLTSQKTKKPVSLEETLSEILEVYLQKLDPVEKAKRNLKAQNKEGSLAINDASASVPGTHSLAQNLNKRRQHGQRYIPSQIKHQVNLRDKRQCAHTSEDGQKCENQRWLEIHHRIPLSKNGTNEVQNLQTLCYVHHRQRHEHSTNLSKH